MKTLENQKERTRIDELNKLNDIFKDVEESKRKLVEGLIEDAAFLKAENENLRDLLKVTGTVKTNPKYPEIQKPVPAAKEYRQNLNSYAVIIKTLNSILSKNVLDIEDDMSEFE